MQEVFGWNHFFFKYNHMRLIEENKKSNCKSINNIAKIWPQQTLWNFMKRINYQQIKKKSQLQNDSYCHRYTITGIVSSTNKKRSNEHNQLL